MSSRGKVRCSNCGNVGHNRLTCPAAQPVLSPQDLVAPVPASSSATHLDMVRPRRRCSLCKNQGHNRLTCPNRTTDMAADEPVSVEEHNSISSESDARVVRCSKCGSTEHRLEACPSIESSTKRRSVRCSKCYRVGHNKRACQYDASRNERTLDEWLVYEGSAAAAGERVCSGCKEKQSDSGGHREDDCPVVLNLLNRPYASLEKSEKELLHSVKEKSLKTSIALAAESTIVGTLSKPDGGLDDILLDGSTQPLADGMHVEALNACAQSYLDSVDPASDLRACAACGILTFESEITVDHDRCRRLSLSDAR